MAQGISPRVHGVLDYTTGTALLAAPRVLGLEGTPAGAVLRAAGASHVGYSLLTSYELGAIKLLPYRAHLAIDAVAACALLSAPWTFGRARRRARWPFAARRTTRAQWLPHAAAGLWELTAVALSVPAARTRAGEEGVPTTSDPVTTDPVTTDPVATDPVTTDPSVTVMPEGADVALADRGAAARRGTGGGTGTGDPKTGGLQT
jgi:hypothetical protein